jgi:hypothetical protein
MARQIYTLRPPALLVLAALGGIGAAVYNMVAWRSAKAKKLYLAQCDVALANPRFSNPSLLQLDVEAQRADGSAETFEQYEWYVARLVYVLDECLKLCPNGEWYAVAETQLGAHREYLTSDYYARQDYLSHYGLRMRGLIEDQRGS